MGANWILRISVIFRTILPRRNGSAGWAIKIGQILSGKIQSVGELSEAPAMTYRTRSYVEDLSRRSLPVSLFTLICGLWFGNPATVAAGCAILIGGLYASAFARAGSF